MAATESDYGADSNYTDYDHNFSSTKLIVSSSCNFMLSSFITLLRRRATKYASFDSYFSSVMHTIHRGASLTLLDDSGFSR
jgi:hypothetical protein